jgi:hypothetical protein
MFIGWLLFNLPQIHVIPLPISLSSRDKSSKQQLDATGEKSMKK